MELRGKVNVSKKRIDYAINILFLAVAIYAFVESRSFSQSTQIWPRNVSILMILTGTLLLFRTYLPETVRPIVEDMSFFSSEEEEVTEQVGSKDEAGVHSEDAENEHDGQSVGRYPIDNSVFTAVSMLSYLVLGFTVGLLWATPIFVAFYCWWFQKPWYLTLILSIVGFGVAYGFWDLLYLPIDQGELTESVIG
ncbi:tripartite tricarboxylate transporter TctB family protein [Halalkalicoccus salilacus]|uniref:tripartite tricarboxylate transporter TctB family protein n=1 Tax=Halalkalicoccus TaxID=332246 RepID=UPI002F960D76